MQTTLPATASYICKQMLCYGDSALSKQSFTPYRLIKWIEANGQVISLILRDEMTLFAQRFNANCISKGYQQRLSTNEQCRFNHITYWFTSAFQQIKNNAYLKRKLLLFQIRENNKLNDSIRWTIVTYIVLTTNQPHKPRINKTKRLIKTRPFRLYPYAVLSLFFNL